MDSVVGTQPGNSAKRLSTLSRSVQGFGVIVTGAASGMGRATAHLFADEGARVVVADRDEAGLVAVVSEIEAVHGTDSVRAVVTDVASVSDLAALVEDAVGFAGRLDAVVNNAGVAIANSLLEPDDDAFEDAWSTTLAVDLSALGHLARLAVPHLRDAPSGRIVNIASTESAIATAGLASYAATKAGVVGLTRSMAVELGRFGITANCICPGPISTAMTSAITDEQKDRYAKRRVALGRYGQPEEVAHMTLNLCLPSSSFVTGATVMVDGGLTIRHT